MSRFQELIAAAQRVCELESQAATTVAIMAAIGRLRTAVAGVKHRGEETFSVFSGVGTTTGAGFVELSGPELPATLPAAAAAEIGHNLIEAAATATTEAALLAELRAMDLGDAQIGGLLSAMRARRAKTA
jgi:hypothetical protein